MRCDHPQVIAMSQSHPPKYSSPCPSSSAPQTPSNRKPTEEVWKEVKLGSLYDCSIDIPCSTTNTRSSFGNLTLHDFLAGPFDRDSSTIVSSSCNPISAAESTFLGSLEQAQPTLLSLSSRSSVFQKQSHDSLLSSFNTSFDALESSSTCACNSKKRAQRDISDSSDRRHMRMIKNRESAARSRARKQAYKNELELKLDHLREENSRLRRQVEELQLQLCLTSSAKHPTMRTLYRTSTSPF